MPDGFAVDLECCKASKSVHFGPSKLELETCGFEVDEVVPLERSIQSTVFLARVGENEIHLVFTSKVVRGK
jgi:hypothetical protein